MPTPLFVELLKLIALGIFLITVQEMPMQGISRKNGLCFDIFYVLSSVSPVRVRLRPRERRAQVFPNLPLTLLDSGGGESSLLRRWTSPSPWTHITASPVDTQHVMLCMVIDGLMAGDIILHATC